MFGDKANYGLLFLKTCSTRLTSVTVSRIPIIGSNSRSDFGFARGVIRSEENYLWDKLKKISILFEDVT